MLKRNRQRGFTLIELLIVVAIIGIIAAILIPNLLDALQKAKQKRTVSDIRNLGTAWMSWLTDQVGAASAGANKVYDASKFTAITYVQIFAYMHPTSTFFYMQDVPQFDGWRQEMAWGKSTNVMNATVMTIAGKCRDNLWDQAPLSVWNVLGFLATDYDRDIVWGDGYFVRWPEGTKR